MPLIYLQAYRSPAVASGAGHLYVWGINWAGDLGLNLNPVATRSVPVQVGTIEQWSTISFGASHDGGGDLGGHSSGIRTTGLLFQWGRNNVGQLGLDDAMDRSSPVQLGSDTWSSTSAGYSFTMAIKSDGTLWSWGENFAGVLGLDLSSSAARRSSPVQIGLSLWTSVACGQLNAMAIRSDGALFSWGSHYVGSGIIGDNTAFINRSSPVLIAGGPWSKVSVLTRNAVAVKSAGTLWTWGFNGNGELGINLPGTPSRSTPTQVGALSTWADASAGTAFAAAIKSDGTLWSWGTNSTGQLGLGDVVERSSPVQVGTDTNWLTVDCDSAYTLALRTDGTMWAWGSNGAFHLAQPTLLVSRSSPVQIGTLSWSQITSGMGVHQGAIRA